MNANLFLLDEISGDKCQKNTPMTMLKGIKKAISMMKGVGKITILHRNRYSAYEFSLRDLDERRVTTHASVDDYFKKFGL